jgi:hypothetical protein
MRTSATVDLSTHNPARGEIPDWLEKVCRVGFFTKGVVYVTLGVLSASAAFSSGGSVEGSKGAIRTLGSQPFGQILLYVLCIGLAAYAAWRLLAAVFDPEQVGTGAKGIAKRVGYTLSGAAHVALAVAAFQMASGTGSGSSRQTWIASLMQEPLGRWAVVALGVFVVGVGLRQFKHAANGDFQQRLRLGKLSREVRGSVTMLGRAGFGARGVVFLIIGFMMARAGLFANPDQAVGVGGALRTLASETGGTIVLGVVAVGLAAYGVYMVVAARYRAIPAP